MALTPTIRKWTSCLAAGLALTAAPAYSSTLPGTALAISLLSPTAGAQPDADRLLKDARQAMKEGNLDLAESLIEQAAKIPPKGDRLFSRFSNADTPDKARADLATLRRNAEGPGARLPSQKFQPASGRPGDKAPASDPFQTKRGPVDIDAMTDDSHDQAAKLLAQGRAALAKGDHLAASAAYREAVRCKAQFAPGEYTPSHFASDLRRAGVDVGEVLAANNQATSPAVVRPADMEAQRDRFPPASDDQPRDRFQSPAIESPSAAEATDTRASARIAPRTGAGEIQPASDTRRLQADRMLLGARKALAAGDDRRAAQLVDEVGRMGIVFPQLDDSPAKVGMLIREHQTLNGPGRSEIANYDRRMAKFLMIQAEGLIPYRELNDARRLAQQAGRMPVKYTEFEKTPDQLMTKIDGEIGAAQAASNAATRLPEPDEGSRYSEPAAPARDVGRERALALMVQAKVALERGEVEKAQSLMLQVSDLKVPDSAFHAGDLRPWELDMKIDRAVRHNGGRVVAAADRSDVEPNGAPKLRYPVSQSGYDPADDRSKTVRAAGDEPTPAKPAGEDKLPAVQRKPEPAQIDPAPTRLPAGEADAPASSPGMKLFLQGEKALKERNEDAAIKFFKQAWAYQAELDPQTRKDLSTRLQVLRPAGELPAGPTREPSLIESLDDKQQVLFRQLISEVGREQQKAEQSVAKQPKATMESLKKLRERVSKAELEPQARKQLLARVDRAIEDAERYITQNRAQIELDERNLDVLAEIDRRRTMAMETGDKMEKIVREYNELMKQERWEEAAVLARKARELEPENPIVVTMLWKQKMQSRTARAESIKDRKEAGFIDSLESVDESGIPFNDRNPYQMPDARTWSNLSNKRSKYKNEDSSHISQDEVKIYRALESKVDVRFEGTTLKQVIQTLSAQVGINSMLDQQGLSAEGVSPEAPVTLSYTNPIALKSALKTILQQLRLTYVVQDDVLKITSEQLKDTNRKTKVYYVADLVIPIPNFVPSYNMGLTGALREAHSMLGYNGFGAPSGSAPLTVMAQNSMPAPTGLGLAQMNPAGAPGVRAPANSGFGPGGIGGANAPDFDSLIHLVTSTIAPQSWTEVGGSGTIQPVESNLTIVVSQTQEVHEEIADLLQQLRRLQDLQVTIEVRFITLSDNFFERIGIDFDFNIEDGSGVIGAARAASDRGPSVTVGLDPTGAPTANLDLEFRNPSFVNALPPFGGFDPTQAATFGFAILSDIEAFFLVAAATGDDRTNVMQAPKVTLFNGQQAFVSDTLQRPFVTSVVPVVGDFAAAHQPVIVVLSEGSSLSVQAVVSKDRRFVRLTLVPFFSKIGEVETFTFDGKKTTSTGTTVVDPTTGEPTTDERDDEVTTTEGTTVQLPEFRFVTVTTTVSVPDGGTVLLGGIKRLSEGRSERGVPFLSKLPYINRLFRNVGIGRDTQSLMMMVTPRIIIQEEEEENLGAAP